ncbi:MAG: ferredoxin family protein, partial [Acidobacteriota bacterium]
MSAQSNPSNPLDASRLRVVLDAETTRRGALLQALLDQGVAVTATGDGAVAPLDGDDLLLLADDIADGDETELDGADGIRLGIDGLDAAGVVDRVKARGQGEASGGWTPWFPVIDYDRCTNCMQCLSFCLFGVYDVDDNKTIDVAQPQRCKTHCPACSRVCPEVAI